jgi:predicted pyridoxine 5'-phosphate oxidase superfamily flavin-nucleotide-binding protein
MANLTEEAKRMIADFYPAVIATADKEGRPNVSLKGSFQVLDDEHVVFADIASPRTIANLMENPKLSAIVFNPPSRKGCRIWGRGEILDSGDLFDSMSAAYAAKNIKVKHVVKVIVEEVVTF